MQVLVSNKRFETSYGTIQEGSFLKGNTLDHTDFRCDVSIATSFVSSGALSVQIIASNQLRLIGGNWGNLGFLPGNEILINATVSFDPPPPSVSIAETVNITDIQGDVLFHDGDLSDYVQQIFPTPQNSAMIIFNNDVAEPDQIDIFFNLVPNNSQGSRASLIDGSVNQIRFNDIQALANTATRNGVFLGNRSGGALLTANLKKVSAGNYELEIDFYNWLSFEFGLLNQRPNIYQGSNSIKPWIEINAFSEANNPNGVIKHIDNFPLGNVGWLDENYNQGQINFTSDILLTDTDGNPIQDIDHTKDTLITITINSAQNLNNFINVVFQHIPTVESEYQNNQFTVAQNTYLSETYGLSNDYLDNIFFPKLGRAMTMEDRLMILNGNQMTFTARLSPTAEFTEYFNSLSPGERYYQITAEVANDEQNNFTRLNVKFGEMEQAPLVGGFADEVKLLQFFKHGENPSTDLGSFNIADARVEDDLLSRAILQLKKGVNYQSLRCVVQCLRLSDGATFNLQANTINFSNFPTDNGKIFIDYFLNLGTTLPSPERNFLRLKNTGVENNETYDVELVQTLFINWREWATNNQAFGVFIGNGTNNQLWSNFDISGFQIRYRLELVKDNTTFFVNRQLSAVAYDEPGQITETKFFDLAGNQLGALPQTGVVRVESTHTLTSGAFDQNKTWAFIKARPKNSEPNRIISSEWNHTPQNAPLQPLAGETKLKLTFPSATVAVAECLLNVDALSPDTSIISRIGSPKVSLCSSPLEVLFDVMTPQNFGKLLIDIFEDPIRLEDRGNVCCPTCDSGNETFGTYYVIGELGELVAEQFGESCEILSYPDDATYKSAVDTKLLEITSDLNNFGKIEFQEINPFGTTNVFTLIDLIISLTPDEATRIAIFNDIMFRTIGVFCGEAKAIQTIRDTAV